MKSLEHCVLFLEANGWKRDDSESDAIISFYKEGCIGVDIMDTSIVLIDDTGDFCHIDINYFTLIGALIEYRQIPFNYKSIRENL